MSLITNRFTKSEFLKNVFTLVSASSVAQAVAIMIYPLLTRIYTPEEHGLFALYMSVISITAIVSTGKYELAIMLPAKDRDGAALAIISGTLVTMFSIFSLIVILIFNNTFTSWLGNPDIKYWLYIVPFSTFLLGIFVIFSNWANRKKKYRNIASANLSQSLVNSSVKVAAPGLASPGAGLILGAILGQVTSVIWFFSVLKRDFPSIKSFRNYDFKGLAKKYSFFPRFNMIHYLVNNFSMVLPVFVFSSYFTAADVGFYSLGFLMINRPMNLIVTSFTQVFSQRVIEKHNQGKIIHDDVKKLVVRLFMLAFLPFLLVGIFGIPIFTFVFGEEWYMASKFMQVMLPWLFMVFLSSPLSFLPDLLNRQKKAMWIDVLKFVLRIIALALGVMLNDIYLALIFFSGVSVLLVSYSFFWYLQLSRKADRLKNN
jgi:O-antigen/teichoic acid export membrane protein